MSRVEAAAPDRLPWLPDEPEPQRVKRRGRRALPGVAGALAIVAAASLWVGRASLQEQVPAPSKPISPSTTVSLPVPRASEPAVQMVQQPEVKPSPVLQVRPSPVHEVRIAPPAQTVAREPAEPTSVPTSESKPEVVALAPVAPSAAVPAKPWNPRVFNGAAGRIVQIGAFGSIHQAKRGWWYMVRAYPAVAHLPAVVRPTRNSRGRIFYRFQIGTTSQAHSEVLCQRMQHVRFSCAVVGLPWKVKVER